MATRPVQRRGGKQSSIPCLLQPCGATLAKRGFASSPCIHRVVFLCRKEMCMRTTVDIDEDLIREVMKLLEVRTKREAVKRSLEAVVREQRRRRLCGKLGRMQLGLTMDELIDMRRDER